MSLENIQGKMSRMEMRNIMAGSGTTGTRWYNGQCYCDYTYNNGQSACGWPCASSNCGY